MLPFYVYTTISFRYKCTNDRDLIVIICLQFPEPVIESIDMNTPRIRGKHKTKVTNTAVLFNSLPITEHLDWLHQSYQKLKDLTQTSLNSQLKEKRRHRDEGFLLVV